MITRLLRNFVFVALGFLVVSSIFGAFSASAKSCGLEPVFCQGKVLVKKARKVFKAQPRLYADRRFAHEQEFPIWAQRLPLKSRVLYQVLTNPAMASSHYLAKEYLKTYDHVQRLVHELPDFLLKHYGMNFVETQKQWKEKVNSSLTAMANGEVETYKTNDCDYVAQTLNYLWFGLNALKLMDQIGQNKYGDRWDQKIHGQTKLLTFDASTLVMSVE